MSTLLFLSVKCIIEIISCCCRPQVSEVSHDSVPGVYILSNRSNILTAMFHIILLEKVTVPQITMSTFTDRSNVS